MVDEKIAKIAKEFITSFNETVKDYPEYHLDFTWPTVGILDYIVLPLRGKKTFSDSDNILITSVAAYLACIFHGAWLSIGEGVRVNCEIRDEEQTEITLRASGGHHLSEGEYFVIPLIRILKNIISNVPKTFISFNNTSLPFTPGMNLINTLSRSIASGLSSLGSGRWKDLKVEQFSREINAICSHLSQSCAEYYATRFPLEDLGLAKEIYRDFLIFPQLGYEEPFPGLRATNGLLGNAIKNNISEDKLYRLALNLSTSHDDLIFCAGYSLSVSLIKDTTPQKLSLITQAKRPFSLAMRAAIDGARNTLKKPYHFLQQYFFGDRLEGERIFNAERELGLLPSWFIPSLDAVNSPIGEAFVGVAYWNMTNYTRSLLDTLQTANALPVELSLLQSYLAFDNGDLSLAKYGIDSVKDINSLTPIQQQEFLLLKGLEAKYEGKEKEAQDYFTKALKFDKTFVTPLAYEELLYLTFKNANDNNHIDLCEEAVSKCPGSFSLRVLEIENLFNCKNIELGKVRLRELITLCPNSPVSFGLVLKYCRS